MLVSILTQLKVYMLRPDVASFARYTTTYYNSSLAHAINFPPATRFHSTPSPVHAKPPVPGLCVIARNAETKLPLHFALRFPFPFFIYKHYASYYTLLIGRQSLPQ